MRSRMKTALLFIVMGTAALALQGEVRASLDVLWLDFDMKSIPEPKERQADLYDALFREQLIEELKQDVDVPRWFRAFAGRPKPAMNVNAVDEVPDSSWYTNRHHLRKMTIDELVRGPNLASAPDFDQATITNAKNAGVSPGMQLKDRKGDTYLIKFDRIDYPELQSGAELISTKILYAAGYNVPENYIAYIDPDRLQIKEGLEFKDVLTGRIRPFTREDLAAGLKQVARMADGRYRVMASKFLPGEPKGPFPHIGIRHDDPNDLIPHEHRRELRGLRVIASWINHWDMKEENGLDMYVEENGRKFLRHYLIDFGSTLGGGQHPTEHFRGHEHVFDVGSIVKEMATLGFYESADEKKGVLISPQVGIFNSTEFDAENWKTTYPVMAFQNMTDADAFWATRVILSFTEPELQNIVETAQYSDPKNSAYILRTLLERRRMAAEHWLRQVNPIARFSVEAKPEGIALNFQDLMADLDPAYRVKTEYVYQIKGDRYSSGKKTTHEPRIVVDRKTLGEAVEKTGSGGPIEVTIWTRRPALDLEPVTVHLFPTADEKFAVRRISRG